MQKIDGQDSCKWKVEKNGLYTVKIAYKVLQHNANASEKKELFKTIWKTNSILNIKHFV